MSLGNLQEVISRDGSSTATQYSSKSASVYLKKYSDTSRSTNSNSYVNTSTLLINGNFSGL